MTNTLEPRLLPPGQDTGACDDPVEADAWRNMIFSRDGSSHLCNPVYPSEQAARDDAEPTLAYIKSLPSDDYVQHHDGQWSEISNISHCLQIPWKP